MSNVAPHRLCSNVCMGVDVCTADAAGMCSLKMNELLWCACMSADGGSASRKEGDEHVPFYCLRGGVQHSVLACD